MIHSSRTPRNPSKWIERRDKVNLQYPIFYVLPNGPFSENTEWTNAYISPTESQPSWCCHRHFAPSHSCRMCRQNEAQELSSSMEHSAYFTSSFPKGRRKDLLISHNPFSCRFIFASSPKLCPAHQVEHIPLVHPSSAILTRVLTLRGVPKVVHRDFLVTVRLLGAFSLKR